MLAGPKDVKDIFSALKDSAAEVSESNEIVKHQVFFSFYFLNRAKSLSCSVNPWKLLGHSLFLRVHFFFPTGHFCLFKSVCLFLLTVFLCLYAYVVDDFSPYPCIFLSTQITFSLLFSLVIALISDALSAVPDKASLLSRDASFRHEFHEIVR